MPERIRKAVVAWAPPIAFMALIFLVSSITIPAVPAVRFQHRDKVVHACEYLVLGWLIARGTRIQWPRRSVYRRVAFSIYVTAFWGLSDELHQAFVPGRSAETLDWVADTLGATFGVLLYARWRR